MRCSTWSRRWVLTCGLSSSPDPTAHGSFLESSPFSTSSLCRTGSSAYSWTHPTMTSITITIRSGFNQDHKDNKGDDITSMLFKSRRVSAKVGHGSHRLIVRGDAIQVPIAPKSVTAKTGNYPRMGDTWASARRRQRCSKVALSPAGPPKKSLKSFMLR